MKALITKTIFALSIVAGTACDDSATKPQDMPLAGSLSRFAMFSNPGTGGPLRIVAWMR